MEQRVALLFILIVVLISCGFWSVCAGAESAAVSHCNVCFDEKLGAAANTDHGCKQWQRYNAVRVVVQSGLYFL